MEVRGFGSVGASRPVTGARPPVETAETASTGSMTPKDEVEISAVGKMMDDVSRVSGLREQRLAQIKSAIENGTYDTPEKLELALGRMLDQIARDEPR